VQQLVTVGDTAPKLNAKLTNGCWVVRSDPQHQPGSREVSLYFVELQFIVKGHESDALPGGVFDVRDLLAGVGIYDPVRRHPDIEDGLDLILVGERAIVWLGKT